MALADGGAAILERRPVTPAPREISFITVATGSCSAYEFARAMRADSSSLTCADLTQATGPRRLLVATGRAAYQPASFSITGVLADAASRVIDVTYRPVGRRSGIAEPSPAAVIELGEALSGEWLVRLAPEGGGLFAARAFVVRFE
jgi:hypothetical protein